ncbi:MAG: 16S rRNA (uracil(1498)-N(3))-methyltransferase [Hyphomicrobiaceae bacterium]
MTNATDRAARLFLSAELKLGETIVCTGPQANYLGNVLRLRPGDRVLLFNGRTGEWQAEIVATDKRTVGLRVSAQTRPQSDGPDVDYLFAPLKRARLDYMVQKATELGVARLRPVLTRYTIADRVNLARMQANVVEAAEQCGILRLPAVEEPKRLHRVLDAWDPARALVFCDEAAPTEDPVAALSGVRRGPLAVLIGPEGGFEAAEAENIRSKPFVIRLSLGPRILRADTAAVAALALINAVLGDWR